MVHDQFLFADIKRSRYRHDLAHSISVCVQDFLFADYVEAEPSNSPQMSDLCSV